MDDGKSAQPVSRDPKPSAPTAADRRPVVGPSAERDGAALAARAIGVPLSATAGSPPTFIFEGELGEGGFGVVRRALDLKLRRQVAVKTLAPRFSGQEQEVERFVREAQLTARLEHPNVVPIHDLCIGPDGGVAFTMRLIEGRTLGEQIRESGSEGTETDRLYDMLQSFLKVCDAVAFAHSREVIHCDIKPDNIMVGTFGEVYLMDWGVSAFSQNARYEVGMPEAPGQQLAVRGTPEYMAPEQAAGRGDEIDIRTDVFSLGAVLYEILTRKAPFQAETIEASLDRARACAFTPPMSVPGAVIAPGIVAIAMKAMAAHPQDRHGSVLELRKDVDRALRGDWNLPNRHFPAGATIIEEGDWGDVAYIITSGRCVVSRRADGDDSIRRRLGPGDVFGEMAILSRARRSATVRALDDVTAKIVTRELLDQQLGVGTWLGRLVGSLADRFRELENGAPGPPTGSK